MSSVFDVIVVGAGSVGAPTAYFRFRSRSRSSRTAVSMASASSTRFPPAWVSSVFTSSSIPTNSELPVNVTL